MKNKSPFEILCTVVAALFVIWLIVDNIYLWFQPNHGRIDTKIPRSKQLAWDITDNWWDSTKGDVGILLKSENNKAVILKYFENHGEGVASIGTWRTTDSTVIINADGPAGKYDLTMEMIEGSPANYLTPTPASTGLLKDSYMQIPPDTNQ